MYQKYFDTFFFDTIRIKIQKKKVERIQRILILEKWILKIKRIDFFEKKYNKIIF